MYKVLKVLELILLVAEVENLKADISLEAEGVIIESYLDAHRGPTTTLILQNGVLKKGDILATVSAAGKIKSLENFQGELVKKALPSMPVVVLGFEQVPGVGEKVKVYTIGPSVPSRQVFSKEVCAGPHAKRTGELGYFKIIKQESVGKGIRRVKGVLE